MSNIIPFDYNTHPIRVQLDATGEPWWIAKDVCDLLGLNNVSRSLARLDEDEVTTSKVTDALGREQETNLINEAGLYELLMTSRKPEAKAFKRWVKHDVLPQIRKTGSYSPATPTPAQAAVAIAQAVLAVEQRVETLEAKFEALEATRPPTGKFDCITWLKHETKPFLPPTMLSVFRDACRRREKPERFCPTSSQFDLLYYSVETLQAAYEETMRQISLFPGTNRRRGTR